MSTVQHTSQCQHLEMVLQRGAEESWEQSEGVTQKACGRTHHCCHVSVACMACTKRAKLECTLHKTPAYIVLTLLYLLLPVYSCCSCCCCCCLAASAWCCMG
jgi:hypothetical protein